jgi:tetratricopeptide (TPR) repeat protein
VEREVSRPGHTQGNVPTLVCHKQARIEEPHYSQHIFGQWQRHRASCCEHEWSGHKGGKPASGFGNLNRTLRFVREGELWKVWGYGPTEKDLAERLASAKTDGERKALLEAEKEWVTVALVAELLNQGYNLANQHNNSRSQDFYGLAVTLTEELGEGRLGADGLRRIGSVYSSQANWTRALEFYQRSLKLEEKIGDKAGVALTLEYIGDVHNGQHAYPQALEFYQRSLKLLEETGDKVGILRGGSTNHGSEPVERGIGQHHRTDGRVSSQP